MAKESNDLLDSEQYHELRNVLANWPDVVMPLFSTLGAEGFHCAVIEAVNRFVPVDSSIVMIFRPDEKPLVVYEALHPGELNFFYETYMAGGYLLSPLYRNYRKMKAGFYRLEALVRDSFMESEFYKAYYNEAGLVDEGNFLVKLSQYVAVVVAFGRRQIQDPFTNRELQQLHVAEPVFRTAIERHWQDMDAESAGKNATKQMHRQLQAALENFGTSILTDREQQVLQMMIEGHASKSSAKELSISPTTEKGHRKNIYGKLHINSQAELFSLLFKVMTSVEPSAEEDPLAQYLELSAD